MSSKNFISTSNKLSLIIITALISAILFQSCHKGSRGEVAPPEKNLLFIKGETITLSAQLPSYLLKKDAKVTSVYKLGANGEIVTYKEGADYLLTNNGGIERTASSSIPDFSTYKVVFNPDGTFSYNAGPDTNPEFPFFWQVMVNYSTDLDSVIHPKSIYLSDTLKSKIKSKQDLSIYAIGTSITAGANTTPTFYGGEVTGTYSQLVAKAITKLYGNKVTVKNLAVGGSTSAILTSNLEKIKSDKPDLVFVEFGINEHARGTNMDDNLAVIENGVKSIKASGIDCVVVGFLQQNPKWDYEDFPRSVYFNLQLNEIANRNNAFFVDIYKTFEQIPEEKRYRDIMADYIHHPTDFGQKIYYLAAVPVFLFEDKNELDLLSLIE